MKKNGGLDPTISSLIEKWLGNCRLVAKGASAIAKEDKKVKSQDNDLLCPEPMERKEQKSV